MPKQGPCFFEHVCSLDRSWCPRCMEEGYNYIVRHLYLKNSRIPRAYLPSGIDPGPIIRANASELILYARSLTKRVEAGKGAYLWSETTGNGKTTVGCNLLLKYLFENIPRISHTDMEYPVLYLNVVELLDDLRRQMTAPDDEFQYLWRVLFSDRAPKLLMLDDIGAEKPSSWVTERMYSLINFRSANSLATIYTSNCSPEQLEHTLGARCASRIQGTCIKVRFLGTDKRRDD